jgi:hypothetical protein
MFLSCAWQAVGAIKRSTMTAEYTIFNVVVEYNQTARFIGNMLMLWTS